MLFAFLIVVAVTDVNWLRLSETDQGPRYVDISSLRRNGQFATIQTELRMMPVIKRTERFDCLRKRYIAEITQVELDSEGQSLLPYETVREWAPVGAAGDYHIMLRIACAAVKDARKKLPPP